MFKSPHRNIRIRLRHMELILIIESKIVSNVSCNRINKSVNKTRRYSFIMTESPSFTLWLMIFIYFVSYFYSSPIRMVYISRVGSWWGVPDTTLCEKVRLCLVVGSMVFSRSFGFLHDIAHILLKVALNTITPSIKCRKHVHEQIITITEVIIT